MWCAEQRNGWSQGNGRHHESDNEDRSDYKHSNELQMALLNVYSICHKATPESNLMNKLILNYHLDILLITETWLKPEETGNTDMSNLLPQNRSFIHRPRGQGRGGGVAIVYSNKFNCYPVILECFISSFECVAAAVQLESWDQPVLIITVYRLPGHSNAEISEFNNEFKLLLTSLSEDAYSSIIVAGDFNIWDNDKNHRSVREFLGLFDEKKEKNELQQFVCVLTHQKGNILDLVISKNMEITDVEVKDDVISDHSTVYFTAWPKISKEEEKNDGKYRQNEV